MPINQIIVDCLEAAARSKKQPASLVKKLRGWLDALADGKTKLSDEGEVAVHIETILDAADPPNTEDE